MTPAATTEFNGRSGDDPQRFARRIQLAMFTGGHPDGLYLELRGRRPGCKVQRIGFYPARELDDISAAIDASARVGDVWVSAAPRTHEDGTAAAVPHVACLWADLDGAGSLQRLKDFHLRPTIEVRSGSPDHVHAYWALSPAVAPDAAHRGCRRLALALDGDMNATDPARILRPAGTLNWKHDPPAPVVCTRVELDVYTAAQVVGALPDSHHYTRPAPIRHARQASDPDRVLDGLLQTVRSAPVGNRNASLFWAACRAAEHAAAGDLDDQALEDLRAAGLDAGLPEHEVTGTIRSALGQSRAAA